MSPTQNDQVFPCLRQPLTAEMLSLKISAALQQDLGNQPHAIKRLSAMLGVKPRTIRNWYEARNVPSLLHLLQLASMSSSLRDFILRELGVSIKPGVHESADGALTNPKSGAENGHSSKINSAILKYSELHYKSGYSPETYLNTPTPPNQRQKWFVGMLRKGHRLKAPELAAHWQVSIRTAKSDIAGLRRLGFIRYTGARKDGEYQAT